MPRAAIGLGSNVGDRLGELRAAVSQLADFCSIVGVSSLFLTEPIGGPEQDEFLNAVVLVDWPDSPEALLAKLQQIENDAGRVRAERWGPRTLDLDLIAMKGTTAQSETLTLPHPRAHLRRFVVAPLAEVWPDAPLVGGTAANHLRNLPNQKAIRQEAIRLAADWQPERIEFLDRGSGWVVAQGFLFATVAATLIVDGSWPSRGRWIGLAPIAIGTYLMLQAAAALGEAFTAFPTPRQGRLAAHGVYRWVRHPMYAGLILLFAGVAILVGSRWTGITAGVSAVFFWAKAGFEEKRLRIVYPGYDEYRDQVRGRLIPGLW